jgi:integrase
LNAREASDTGLGETDQAGLAAGSAASKTPIVGPHGLRGAHATLAVEAGVTGDVVAAGCADWSIWADCLA